MHPAFALASRKLEQLEKEYELFLRSHAAVIVPLQGKDTEESRWSSVALTSTGIEHVYTGIEGVLKSLLGDIDGGVFAKSDEYHKALLAQSAAATDDRPPIISDRTFELFDELRGFRHAERNNYGHALRPADVEDNFRRTKDAMRQFRDEVKTFITSMSQRYEDAERMLRDS